MGDVSPIFIHSLFRAGSTYIFNAFRRAEKGYWCYQEPENEFLIHLNGDANKLLENSEGTVSVLRHPQLNKPYYWEFYQIKDDLKGLFRKSFSYDTYFIETMAGFTADLSQYFNALITYAKGRPVLQLCRSSGRIGAFKQSFGGIHIHLWRDPRNQWWSFKVNNYFDSVVQLIFNASGLPTVLSETRDRCGIAKFHSDEIEEELEYALRHPLVSTKNYFAFYSIWLYSFLEGEKYADVTVNIDHLSVDEIYCNQILQRFVGLGIDGLDFSDCSIPSVNFTVNEKKNFTTIENQVHDLFLSNGYSKYEIEKSVASRERELRPNSSGQEEVLRDATRAREMALRYLDQYARAAECCTQNEEYAAQAEERAAQAEERAAQTEERGRWAEANMIELVNKMTSIDRELACWRRNPIKSLLLHYSILLKKDES